MGIKIFGNEAKNPKKVGDECSLSYIQYSALSEIIINFDQEQAGVTGLKWI